MTKKYTEDELRKASDHLFYEIWMINQTANILENKTKSLFVSLDSHHANSSSPLFINSTGVIQVSRSSSEEDIVQRALNNALIEAFAIHVRSMLDFFYARGEGDNIVAEHFFSSSSDWTLARPPKTDNELKAIKNRVNKEIAHLTYTRQKVKSKIWLFKDIRDDINEVVGVFSNIVSKNLLGSHW